MRQKSWGAVTWNWNYSELPFLIRNNAIGMTWNDTVWYGMVEQCNGMVKDDEIGIIISMVLEKTVKLVAWYLKKQ